MNFYLNLIRHIFSTFNIKLFIGASLFVCINSFGQTTFQKCIDQKEVDICLEDYGLEHIPDDIGLLTNVERLSITPKSKSWLVFSITPWDEYPDNPLTEEIGKLINLRVLTLNVLELTSLPDSFVELQLLDTLRLPGNHLDINLEMEKLKQLPNLKYLDVLGNKIDNDKVEQWLQENPNLYIKYALDTIR